MHVKSHKNYYVNSTRDFELVNLHYKLFKYGILTVKTKDKFTNNKGVRLVSVFTISASVTREFALGLLL